MPQENLSTTIHVRISPALHQQIAVKAERDEQKLSELVRRAICAELEGTGARTMAPHPARYTSCSRGE